MNTPNTEITLWIEFRRLVLGLPSVVIATGAIFLVTQEHRTRADLIGDYQWAAATAMRGQDWDKADVYYRKLAWLHETDVATQYGLALVAEQQGDHDRARGLMSDIAPDDSAGFGPAHFWLARDLVRRTNRKPPAPNVLETLERHPDHASAHVMLGRFYRGQGRVKRVRELFEKAAWHLAKVTPGYPKYRLELAALYRILGNAAQAESLAEASGDHFQQELDADRNGAGVPASILGSSRNTRRRAGSAGRRADPQSAGGHLARLGECTRSRAGIARRKTTGIAAAGDSA